MKSYIIVDFADIFHFANEKFDICWNTCNDLFFGLILEFNTCQEWFPDSGLLPDGYESMSKEEILKLDEEFLATVIIMRFITFNNLQGQPMMINSQ